MSRRRDGQGIDGVLILDKPNGITSNRALQIVKRIFNAQKAGHTGSLDPLATGLLPICFGEATKYSQFLLDADKRYEVTAQLGVITDSGDAEGKIIEERTVPEISSAHFAEIVENFRGEIEQVPSMFSALKHQGKPLYELARQGIVIDRKRRKIKIYELIIRELTPTTFRLSVHCSKGTYIRSLVEDIGLALGCGAHVTQLRRIAAGPFIADQMHTLESLESNDNLIQLLLPPDSLVNTLPKIVLGDIETTMLQQGKAVIVPDATMIEYLRLYSTQAYFLGIGTIDATGKLTSRRLTSTV
ncbi:MAG: tRNA pseudouridine(55) synthase TruB [Pseudomonadota bacterium]|nr:tRNA pseudouridine(55) synthase TruB [Pseudomonadota bacterium]